jgi:hypothetical protein
MKFLAIERENPGIKWDEEQATLAKEATCVYRLIQENKIREIYFTETHNAVLILECGSREEAENILKEMPIAQKGLSRFDLCELKPYTGLDRLINKQ